MLRRSVIGLKVNLGRFVMGSLQVTHRSLLLFVEGLKGINFALKGGFEDFLLGVTGGRSNLFADVGNVGHDLFALVGEVLFNQVHEFLGDGLGSDLVGRDVGCDIDLVLGGIVIGVSLGGTFLGSSNVDFVELESADLALDEGKEPGGSADSGPLKEESGLEEDIDDRVAQESNREASGNQLPGDGTKDGGGDGTHESQVEKTKLDPVRDIEDVRLVSDINVDGSDTGNDEKAKGDSHLATAHESRKVLSAVLEEAFAGLEGQGGRSALGLRKLGDGEEGNLHTFEKTDAAHKNEEEDEGDSFRKSFPGGGLSTVESFNGDSKGESEDTEGEKDTSPEEDQSESGLGRLVRFNRLSSGPESHHTDQVRSVHDTGYLNSSGNPVGEGHEVVVDVVKHHVGSVTLGSQLSNDNVLQDHSHTGSEEDGSHPVRKSKNLSSGERGSAKSDGEVDEDNHELTSHEVSVEVVSLVGPSGDLVGDRVRFAVEFAVDWGKTDQGALSSFNHGHPDDKSPHDDTGGGRVDIAGQLGVSGSDQSQNDGNGEDQKEKRVDNFDLVENGVNSVGSVISAHLESNLQLSSYAKVESDCLV